MRKGALVAGVLALCLMGVTACGNSTPTTADGKTELTWGMWVSGTDDQNAWQKVADEASATLGDVKITLQGATFQDYFTKMSTQLASGNAPCLVAVQSLRTAQLKDGLLPLADLVKKNNVDLSAFDKSMIDGLSADGNLYALPYDVGPVVMFYNKDMFAAAGLPEPKPGWTADEFLADAKKLTGNGKYAIAPDPADLSIEPQILAYNGGRVLTTDAKLDPKNSAFSAGLQWVSDLTNVYKVSPQLPGGDTSFSTNQFQAGTTAMHIDGPWSLLDAKAKVSFNLGVTTLPAGPGGGKTYSAGSGWGISKNCATPDKAFAALKEMTGDKILSELGAAGRALPARTADQPSWINNAKIPGVDALLKTASSTAAPMPSNTNSDQLGTLFNQYLIKSINGQQKASDVMNDIASQLPAN
ncbi:ABC transporter substrate-binding protein [Psychromicrobium xiongbiense]|uniref:ABC transporter substrate-binding protein n=1 Tax=Psychromicrobium xiongbiense TaxID=3051184 RepID=UPI002555E289|nr:sugar ABC transporter substrate-binding protein [Psychromicrobium sp. YIM S02556]